MSQTFFDNKGAAVSPKCIDCGIGLLNYSLWYEGEGPLCPLCNKKRVENRIDKPRGNVNG